MEASSRSLDGVAATLAACTDCTISNSTCNEAAAVAPFLDLLPPRRTGIAEGSPKDSSSFAWAVVFLTLPGESCTPASCSMRTTCTSSSSA